ncbi:MAG: oligosaccharide flippase family protein [Flavipsychrobacter sp.]
MKNNLLKKIFSSGLQAVSVQILGVIFLFIVSFYLSESEFGIISWYTAVTITITTLLSFGIDQVAVRRIAASERSDWAAAAYLFHAFVGSVIAFVILVTITAIWSNSDNTLRFLPWFFIAQSLMYIGTPLKQFLNAKQKFAPYGVIAVISNLTKISLAYWGIYRELLSVDLVYAILIICALIELVGLLIYILKYTSFSFRFKFVAYRKLIKESTAQYIAMVFDTGISRLDWILLGIISTNAITGVYAFAYRAYELTRLPITVIAPVILNIFSKLLVSGKKPDEEKQAVIRQLFTVGVFAAILMPLVLNILWAPTLDWLYNGKYGSSNAVEFLLLTICIPFQFTINLLWTLTFASKNYTKVTKITIVTAVTNLLLNLLLIPFYGGLGAAVAYLITNLVQMSGYYLVVKGKIMAFPLRSLLLFLIMGAIAYSISTFLTDNLVLQLVTSLGVYISLAILTKQVRKDQIGTLKMLLKK